MQSKQEKDDRYKVDIAALSETRFAGKGNLTEIVGGYAFFWSGRSREEQREVGVVFAITTTHVLKLASIPEGLNDRLMKMQLPLGQKTNAPLISAYAPSMTSLNEIKDGFYEGLDSLIASVPREAHHPRRSQCTGLLLHSLCASHDLAITHTMFRQPTRN